MTAVELLKNDHRKVSNLMEEVMANAEGDYKIRVKKIEKITENLNDHMEMEEKYLYPLLETYKETQTLAEHSYVEHQKVVDDLADINKLDEDDETWFEKFVELKADVEHHVKEEETKLFPLMQETLPQKQLGELLKNFESFKKKHEAAVDR